MDGRVIDTWSDTNLGHQSYTRGQPSTPDKGHCTLRCQGKNDAIVWGHDNKTRGHHILTPLAEGQSCYAQRNVIPQWIVATWHLREKGKPHSIVCEHHYK